MALNAWFWIVLIVLAIVALAVILMPRVTRSDQVLGSHPAAVNPRTSSHPHAVSGSGSMSSEGRIEQGTALTLLKSAAADRTTGCLQLSRGDAVHSWYFLFGHIFHATGPGVVGEPAIWPPLSWTGGTYRIDRESQLPTEETIKLPMAGLLAEAERRAA